MLRVASDYPGLCLFVPLGNCCVDLVANEPYYYYYYCYFSF